MMFSRSWSTPPLCASLWGRSTGPWKPQRLKGKSCLPLLAHRPPPTWYFKEYICIVVAHLNLLTHVFILFSPLWQDDSKDSSTRQRSPFPKHSALSLDLNANENSGTEQSGSESIEDGTSTPTRLLRCLNSYVYAFWNFNCLFSVFSFSFPFSFFNRGRSSGFVRGSGSTLSEQGLPH